jgi:hypothetical protein
VQHLRNISINEYVINVVDFNVNVPFTQQLNITHNTDIFMGMVWNKISNEKGSLLSFRNAWGWFNSFTLFTRLGNYF